LMLAATRTPIGLATALFATAMTIAAAPADAARLALVIGNDNYQYATSLQNARADAQAVARTLERAKFGPSSGKPGAVRSRCAGAIPGGPPSGTFFHGTISPAPPGMAPMPSSGGWRSIAQTERHATRRPSPRAVAARSSA